MVSQVKLMEELKAALQAASCQLCKGPFNDPVTLPQCGHVFCRSCVIATMEGPGIVKSQCPTCGVPGWKKELVSNHTINNAQEHIFGIIARIPGNLPLRERMERLNGPTKRKKPEQEEEEEEEDSNDADTPMGQHGDKKTKQTQQASKKFSNHPATGISSEKENTQEDGEISAHYNHPSQKQQEQQHQTHHHHPPPLSTSPAPSTKPPSKPPTTPASPPLQFSLGRWIEKQRSMATPGTFDISLLKGEIAAVQRALRLCNELPVGTTQLPLATSTDNYGNAAAVLAAVDKGRCQDGDGDGQSGRGGLIIENIEEDQNVAATSLIPPLITAMPKTSQRAAPEEEDKEEGQQQHNHHRSSKGHPPSQGVVISEINANADPDETQSAEIIDVERQQQYQQGVEDGQKKDSSDTQNAAAAFFGLDSVDSDNNRAVEQQQHQQQQQKQVGEDVGPLPVLLERRPPPPPPPPPPPHHRSLRVVISANVADVQNKFLTLQKQVKHSAITMNLDDTITEDTTHVLVDTDDTGMAKSRTAKFLGGLAVGAWLVSHAWLDACTEAGELVAEAPFECKGLKNNNPAFGVPGISRRRAMSGQPPLFGGIIICMPVGGSGSGAGSAVFPLASSRNDMYRAVHHLIQLSGGTVMTKIHQTALKGHHQQQQGGGSGTTSDDSGGGGGNNSNMNAHLPPASVEKIKLMANDYEAYKKIHLKFPDRPVLSGKWVLDSLTHGKLLPEKEYINWEGGTGDSGAVANRSSGASTVTAKGGGGMKHQQVFGKKKGQAAMMMPKKKKKKKGGWSRK
jgi:hypothetical protein